MGLKARLIEEVGTRVWLRVYWDDVAPCKPGRAAFGGKYFHDGQIFLMDSPKLADWKAGGEPGDYGEWWWPKVCDDCGMPAPASGATRQVFRKRLYNTASGQPEPGDLFYADWYDPEDDDGKKRCFYWDNCDGRHLQAILPNGAQWDIDGRASNCGLKEDRLHRCWVRTGTPPLITVGKGGLTCPAGAGSIAVPGWHGFLRNGEFVVC